MTDPVAESVAKVSDGDVFREAASAARPRRRRYALALMLAAQAVQHDADFLLGRVLLPRRPPNVLHDPLGRQFLSSGFLAQLHSSMVTMSQKSSVLQPAKSVSRVLTPDSSQSCVAGLPEARGHSDDPLANITGPLWLSSNTGERMSYSSVERVITDATRLTLGVAVSPIFSGPAPPLRSMRTPVTT